MQRIAMTLDYIVQIDIVGVDIRISSITIG